MFSERCDSFHSSFHRLYIFWHENQFNIVMFLKCFFILAIYFIVAVSYPTLLKRSIRSVTVFRDDFNSWKPSGYNVIVTANQGGVCESLFVNIIIHSRFTTFSRFLYFLDNENDIPQPNNFLIFLNVLAHHKTLRHLLRLVLSTIERRVPSVYQ